MAKVHQDKHSVYVRVGGYIFRPVFPVGYQHVHKDGSGFSSGDTVRGKHRGGPLLNIRHDDGREETWYSHGPYMGTGANPSSEDNYKPKYEQW